MCPILPEIKKQILLHLKGGCVTFEDLTDFISETNKETQIYNNQHYWVAFIVFAITAFGVYWSHTVYIAINSLWIDSVESCLTPWFHLPANKSDIWTWWDVIGL